MGSKSGGGYFDLRGAVLTQDLLDQMNAMNRASEGRAVRASSTIARKGAGAVQQSMRRLGTT
jgi:hypothetical protein